MEEKYRVRFSAYFFTVDKYCILFAATLCTLNTNQHGHIINQYENTLAASVNVKNKQIVHRVFVNINLHGITRLHVYGKDTKDLGTWLMIIDGRLGLKTIILFHACHHCHNKDVHSIKLSVCNENIYIGDGRKKIRSTNLTRRARLPLCPVTWLMIWYTRCEYIHI